MLALPSIGIMVLFSDSDSVCAPSFVIVTILGESYRLVHVAGRIITKHDNGIRDTSKKSSGAIKY